MIDPAAGTARMACLARRGGEIFVAGDGASGFLGRAEGVAEGAAMHAPGEGFGRRGRYALPLGLPDLAGTIPISISRR